LSYTSPRLLAAVFAGCVATIACTGAPKDAATPPAAAAAGATGDTAMGGMGNMTGGVAAADIKIPDGSDYAVADVQFMQGMIAHHTQALQMAAMAPTHGANSRVTKLCLKITISQTDEINMMEDWLRARHQVVPDTSPGHLTMMPGMLTGDQMKALAAAHGTDFDRLFLTGMIQHHQGAINMVADLFATPGAAKAPDMYGYANDVQGDQTGEIGVMHDMLNALPGTKPQ
jgi:uncharacterized protein (DUF305 family)